MSKRAIATVPTLATLAALFYLMTKKAQNIAPRQAPAFDPDAPSMHGLGFDENDPASLDAPADRRFYRPVDASIPGGGPNLNSDSINFHHPMTRRGHDQNRILFRHHADADTDRSVRQPTAARGARLGNDEDDGSDDGSDDGMNGYERLGELGFSLKKAVKKVVSAPKKIITAPALKAPIKVLKTSVSPSMQIDKMREVTGRNKLTAKLFKAATAVTNPVMQVKRIKDEFKGGYSGKNKLAKWALFASDPVYQQKVLKKMVASKMGKKKSAQNDKNDPPLPALTFPYQIEPGVWVDKNGYEVNRDGTPIDGGNSGAQTVGQGVPSINYDNIPSVDPAYGDPGYNPGIIDPAMLTPDQQAAQNEFNFSENAPEMTPENIAPLEDSSKPYFDKDSGLWYNPADDSYYNEMTGQYYDGWRRPVDKNGNVIAENNGALNVNPSQSYMDQSGSDDADTRPEEGAPYWDPQSRKMYDPQSDHYYDVETGAVYDGYMNLIPVDSESLQGLGALGRIRVAKKLGIKVGAIAGVAATVVGCYYASGACPALVAGEAALLAKAYEKHKQSPGEKLRKQQEQQRLQAQQAHDAEVQRNRNQLVTVGAQPNLNAVQDPETGIWFDPKSNTYYDPQSQSYYDPATQQYDMAQPGEGPANY